MFVLMNQFADDERRRLCNCTLHYTNRDGSLATQPHNAMENLNETISPCFTFTGARSPTSLLIAARLQLAIDRRTHCTSKLIMKGSTPPKGLQSRSRLLYLKMPSDYQLHGAANFIHGSRETNAVAGRIHLSQVVTIQPHHHRTPHRGERYYSEHLYTIGVVAISLSRQIRCVCSAQGGLNVI